MYFTEHQKKLLEVKAKMHFIVKYSKIHLSQEVNNVIVVLDVE